MNQQSRIAKLFRAKKLFREHPLIVVDIGICSGPAPWWHQFNRDIQVIGFEPQALMAEYLNQEASSHYPYPITCYPCALASQPSEVTLFTQFNKAASSLIRHEKFIDGQTEQTVETKRLDTVIAQENLPAPDFVRIDTNGSELDVLGGFGDLLTNRKILGFEISTALHSHGEASSFGDIDICLRKHGYCAMDMQLLRSSYDILPMPVAGDHRDHEGNPIFGPTITGPITHVNAVYFKDIHESVCNSLDEDIGGQTQLYKLLCLFDIYGLPDCAAELAQRFERQLGDMVNLTDILDALTPDYFGHLSYKEYMKSYMQRIGRADDSKKRLLPTWKKAS